MSEKYREGMSETYREGMIRFSCAVSNRLPGKFNLDDLLTECDHKVDRGHGYTARDELDAKEGHRKMCKILFKTHAHSPSRPGPESPCFCSVNDIRKNHRGLCKHFLRGIIAFLEKRNVPEAMIAHAIKCDCGGHCGCEGPIKDRGDLHSYHQGVMYMSSILG